MDTWYAASVQGWSVYMLCWLFVAYGFLGVVIETAYCLVREGVLESRFGLLYLPLRPMYGIGGVASTVLLDRFQQKPALVFVGGMLICSVVEYAAGSICDNVFGTLSWDYHSKALHLHGKICLQYSCYWGVLVALTVYVLNPLILSLLSRLEPTAGETVLTTLICLMLASVVLTTAAWTRTRRRLGVLREQADAQLVAVPVTVAGRIIDLLVPDLLMINTFPRTRLAAELVAVTGQQRLVIRWPSARSASPRVLGENCTAAGHHSCPAAAVIEHAPSEPAARPQGQPARPRYRLRDHGPGSRRRRPSRPSRTTGPCLNVALRG